MVAGHVLGEVELLIKNRFPMLLLFQISSRILLVLTYGSEWWLEGGGVW